MDNIPIDKNTYERSFPRMARDAPDTMNEIAAHINTVYTVVRELFLNVAPWFFIAITLAMALPGRGSMFAADPIMVVSTEGQKGIFVPISLLMSRSSKAFSKMVRGVANIMIISSGSIDILFNKLGFL